MSDSLRGRFIGRVGMRPKDYFVSDDIVARERLGELEFGIVQEASYEGKITHIFWVKTISPRPPAYGVGIFRLRLATETEKVMLRLTGKI
jgi:hypothetical protein